MSASLRILAVLMSVLAPCGPAAWGAALECGRISLAYDALLKDSAQRLQEAATEGMAMPEQQRHAVRPKICAISGEIVGYYRLIQLLAEDCAKQGAAMADLLDEIKDHLGVAEEELRKHCSVRRAQ